MFAAKMKKEYYYSRAVSVHSTTTIYSYSSIESTYVYGHGIENIRLVCVTAHMYCKCSM